jgi:hypothetical protein
MVVEGATASSLLGITCCGSKESSRFGFCNSWDDAEGVVECVD